MEFNEIAEKHTKLLLDIIESYRIKIRDIESELYTDFFNDFSGKVVIQRGRIFANASTLNNLPAWKKYYKKSAELGSWIVSKMKEISFSLNNYFGFVTKKQVSKEVTEASKFLLSQIGFDGEKLTDKGFLQMLTRDITPERRIKLFALQAINAGKSLTDFQKDLKKLISGDKAAGRKGVVAAHYKTNSDTLFSEFDRTLSFKVAEKYELHYVLWSGPTLKSSRPFCRRRKGKSFSVAEIKAMDKETWAGKIPGQSTIISAGGYNCIDNLLYITQELYEGLTP